MPRSRTVTIGLAAVTTAISASLAMGVAASPAAASASHHRPSAPPAAHGTTVKTAHSKLGTYLVDANGNTLYLFEKDEHSVKSHCYHACAGEWPPLLTHGAPKAGGKAKSGRLGTTTRKNGKQQVTYKGHPLYFFDEDTKAGQKRGEGVKAFGAEWTIVSPKGNGIDND